MVGLLAASAAGDTVELVGHWRETVDTNPILKLLASEPETHLDNHSLDLFLGQSSGSHGDGPFSANGETWDHKRDYSDTLQSHTVILRADDATGSNPGTQIRFKSNGVFTMYSNPHADAGTGEDPPGKFVITMDLIEVQSDYDGDTDLEYYHEYNGGPAYSGTGAITGTLTATWDSSDDALQYYNQDTVFEEYGVGPTSEPLEGDHGLDVTISVDGLSLIPEPATMAIMSAGAVGLVGLFRRRRRR
jgi:hypothetical protein